MYCSTCGVKVPADKKHCQQCGSTIVKSAHSSEKKPLAVLKPLLIIWLVVARYFIVQLNMTFVGGALGGVIIFVHHLFQGAPVVSWKPFFYAAIFFFCTVPIVAIFIHKRTYDLTRYIFYTDHLEYYEGFWNVERKIINYRSITEVELKQTIIQRFYHLGSIHVLVPSLGGKHSGIIIADIKHSEKLINFYRKR